MSKNHHKKCWTEYFELTLEGKKPFELRINDCDYEVGDTLTLCEYDKVAKVYTGREITSLIEIVMEQPEGCPHNMLYEGAVVLGLRVLEPMQAPGQSWKINPRGITTWEEAEDTGSMHLTEKQIMLRDLFSNLEGCMEYLLNVVLIKEQNLSPEEVEFANQVMELVSKAESMAFEWPGESDYALSYLQNVHISGGSQDIMGGLVARLEAK